MMHGPGSQASAASGGVTAVDAGGLRVLFRPNPAHEVVAARFCVRGGTRNLTPATSGTELLLGRVARRGTARYPKSELHAALARIGADLGTAGTNDFTVYNLRCLRRHLDLAWDLFTEVIVAPRLDAADVEVVRQQMRVELRQQLDTPDGALGERAREVCYRGHAYAPNPAGTDAALAKLEAGGLREHAARWWTRRNALLVVVGDLDSESLRRAAGRFEALPLGDAPALPPPPLAFAESHLHVEPRALPTQYVLGHFAAPSPGDDAEPALRIAMSVLRDRFFEEVRTKRNLSYAPSASLGQDAANLGSIYVSTTAPARTLEIMRGEMRRLMEEPLDPEDLAHEVRTFVTRSYLQTETNHAWAGFLARYELVGGGWQRAAGFVARLEAVRPADVQRAAQDAFRNVQWVYLGDPAQADRRIFADP